tara:strand:+ start:1039 stop:1371 length:333 start_codon:yes stop_codon:yes gene_type:complete
MQTDKEKKLEDFLFETLLTFQGMNDSSSEDKKNNRNMNLVSFFMLAAERSSDFYEASLSEDVNILGLLIDIDAEFKRSVNMDFIDVVEKYHTDDTERQWVLKFADGFFTK